MKATINGVRIAGLHAAVPTQRHSFVETPEMFSPEEARKLATSIGVRERRIAPPNMLASDLAVAAAERLLADLDWDPSTIDAIVFVTQGPDYLLPATACLMQKRLGLPTSCAAFDVNLGCSGYVYGLWLVSQLLAGSQGRRALLLCGDVSSRLLLPGDRSTRPLFGDAGAATALERSDEAAPIHVTVGTDARGAEHISIKAGGLRHNLVPVLRGGEAGTLYEDAHLHLNGPEIFTFTLRIVPALVRDILDHAGCDLDAIDYCVMHQANKFILEHLRNKTKIPPGKFIIDMESFGNTSSASIPLAICHSLSEPVATRRPKLLLGGFGVGWSWGGMVLDIGPIVTPGVIEVPEDFPRLAL
ncbi:3-oxoacyl-ACP synthase [Aliidongia dinghuensis]|uniref:3-oxoacyl-ACP synthase n=1 Tax=Aliidongia dinghuensis TaxID=1867774 RepID=A0A8J2YUI7_9PROT|nr:ketoacyl-ACP synthase III [Aliidongia dinghuensis]GGF24022.1 3-oxoacyl-ACP synthase [Aliidongia dinghuensis]